MQSLNALVLSGKVLYLGISDTPAWVVSKANEYARQNGMRQFSVYQGKWNAGYRDFERDIIPMCKEEGMGLCPWGALGGGNFKTEEQRKANDGRKMTGFEATEADKKISKVLEKLATKYDTQLTSVALSYVMHKASLQNCLWLHTNTDGIDTLCFPNHWRPQDRPLEGQH